MTLACEEGDVFSAHKIILAASSPVLNGILLNNQHSNPFIYMKGVKSKDLLAILDFVYCGKAKILQSDLTNFLMLAEELKIKGLAGEESERNAQTSDQKEMFDAEKDDSCSEIDKLYKLLNKEVKEQFDDVLKDNADENNEVDRGTQEVQFQSKTGANGKNCKCGQRISLIAGKDRKLYRTRHFV